MALSISPAGFANPIGYNQFYTIPPSTDTTSGNLTTNVNALTAYENILALEATNTDLFNGDLADAGTNPTSLGTTDLLTLSPQALNVLNGVNNDVPLISTENAVTATVNPAEDTTTANDLVQNNALAGDVNSDYASNQQQEISQVLSQFVNAPLNTTTLTQLQSALQSAGVNPLQVSLQELLLSANAGLTSYSDAIYPDYQADLLDA